MIQTDANLWDIVRSVSALGALLFSLLAFFFARRDKNVEAQASALKKVSDRIDALETVTDDRHQSNTSALGRIDTQLARIEEGMKNAPSARDLDQLQASITSVVSSVARLEGAQQSAARTLLLINEHLMGKGR